MKKFKLMVKDPMIEIYDTDYNPVMPVSEYNYELKAYYSKKLDVYVTKPYYALKITYNPFTISVDKFICVSEGLQYVSGPLFCINGMLKIKVGAIIYERDAYEFLKAVVKL